MALIYEMFSFFQIHIKSSIDIPMFFLLSVFKQTYFKIGFSESEGAVKIKMGNLTIKHPFLIFFIYSKTITPLAFLPASISSKPC